MKKVIITLLFCLIFCKSSFAETYYFKGCKLSENVTGDYELDLKKKEIYVTLKSLDGTVQEFVDKIKLSTKDRVVSEIIQQENREFSTQYILDSNVNSISRQLYKREIEIDLIRPEGPPKTGYCENVKYDWFKTDEQKKREEEIKKIQLLEQQIANESTLSSCLKTDVKEWTNCRGTFKFKDEYIYVGEWLNGKQHGKGIELMKDGRKYVGQFKNDKRDGKGIFTMPDGTKFTGSYKEGKKDGQGIFIWANGDKYVGNYQNGKANGKGVYTFASGNILSGNFIDGEIREGTAAYADGCKYVGEFSFDQPNGNGTFTYANGAKFIGNFTNGRETGEGVCIKPNGAQQNCIMPDKNTYLGRNKYNISILGDWHKLEKQLESREQLIVSFSNKAAELCVFTGMGDFKELEKKIKVQEVDETPAFGLDPVYKLIIQGVVECK